MCKKFFIMALLVMLILSTCNMVFGNTPLYGDLNGDGRIDSTDIILMNRHVLGVSTLSNTTVADLNGDGQINSTDYVLLRRYILEIISVFPVQNMNPITPSEGQINLGSTITYSGSGIRVDGSVVTITSGGEFTISGTLSNGMIKVETRQEVRLNLNGASVTNSNGPAIYIKDASKAYITLANGTTNNLTDGSNYTNISEGEKIEGTLSSNASLEIGGNGTLNVRGNYDHGIISYKDLHIKSGNIVVTGAVTDGIHAKDLLEVSGGSVKVTASSDGFDSKGNIRITGGTLDIKAGKHGMTANNNIDIGDGNVTVEAERDAITADGNISIDKGSFEFTVGRDGITAGGNENPGCNITINNGQFRIRSGSDGIDASGNVLIKDGNISIAADNDGIKGEDIRIDGGVIDITRALAEGIDCKRNLIINDGRISIVSTLDAIDASNSIVINGGSFNLRSAEQDGIDSSGTLTITGGTFTINAGKDGIKVDGNIRIDDGTFNITAKSDGIETDRAIEINGGDFTISVDDEGIRAIMDVVIKGGKFNITRSYEGIESDSAAVIIHDGEFTIVARDDGISAQTNVTINGGNIHITADHDGIDSNGTVNINGGYIYLVGGGFPEGSVDCDSNTFSITGGTLIGMAANTSPITESVTTQPVLVLGGARANSVISIRTGNTEVLNLRVPRTHDTLLFSSPELRLHTTYTMYVDGNQTRTFTTNSIVTVAGGTIFDPFGGGGWPGWPGGPGGGWPGWGW
ncbi:UNVERIFIED_CONTAM: hypothetical protein Cloal_0044 [Acetivibrio alkalicellulosi]